MLSNRSTKLLITLLILAVPMAGMISLAESMYSTSPPDGRTGAPGDDLCTGCHGTYEVNSGDGLFEILYPNGAIRRGDTITITISLEDPGQERWGFELTALDENDNGIGTFLITDAANTQLSDGGAPPARDYVKHTTAGTFAGTANGPVTWNVNYVVPEERAHSEVFFYAAGNAANNNGSSSGDYIYTAMSTIMLRDSTQVPVTSTVGLIILIVLLITAAFFVLRKRAII